MSKQEFTKKFDRLANRQKQVLLRVLTGDADAEIAKSLNIAESTVRQYIARIYQGFGIRNVSDERRSMRADLVVLFAKYKPELLDERFSLAETQAEIESQYVKHQLSPEFPGRPVPPKSPFYIQRFYNEHLLVETLCSQTVLQPGALIRIKAPKKMGKTSLLNHILAEATHSGYQTIRLNLRQAEETILDSLDHFLQWFCTNISQKLNLELHLDDYWDNERLGSMASCTNYFQAYLLEQLNTPLVLGLDDVDRLFEHQKIAQLFFALLRSWHEEANNLEVWQKLRLVLVHSTEVYISLNIHQSPFNVGLPIKLAELTLEQVQQLAKEYELKWLANSELERLRVMVGGHPYLVQLALYHLHQGVIPLEQFLQTAPTPAGIYRSYLQELWVMLSEHSELLEALKTLRDAGSSVQLEPILAYELESMGIVRFEGNQVKFSCKLYHSYFSSCLGA